MPAPSGLYYDQQAHHGEHKFVYYKQQFTLSKVVLTKEL